MTISGFSFVRNAIDYDFPLVESLRSLLPLCDEVVIAVGRSHDGTLEAVHALNDPKIRVVETEWDDSLREGGRVYAQQTDIALSECSGDWLLYLQADEVLHEADEETIRRELAAADADERVEALLFRYLHFYGNYDHIGTGRQWYRREIRAVRNTGAVVSWGDAQGFRRRAGDSFERLRARQTEARVFHYGWVKSPQVQARKQRAAHRFWHDDRWIEENLPQDDHFDYSSAFSLKRYTGTHPALMRERIAASAEWAERFDATRLQPKPFLVAVTDWIEERTGHRIGEYKNFVEI